MKKVLLGGTALVALGLWTGAAAAQVELTITGNVDAQFGYGDDEFDGDQRDYGFTSDTTLNFNAAGVADNGLEYGARINIDDGSIGGSDTSPGSSSFIIDETWVYVRESFGELRLGEKEGQASNLRFAVPSVGNGQADGDFGRYINDFGVFGTDFIDSADDAKISYIGMFSGFTIGASYSPTTGQQLSNPGFTDNDGDFENIFSVGANYKGDFGGTSIGVSGGFATGDFEEDQDGTPPVLGNDLQEFGVGAEFGFGGIVVGGFYVNSEGGAVDDRDRYGVGITYSTGPWAFAANALFAEQDTMGGGDQEDQVFGVGLAFDIAPGLQTYADLVFFDYDLDAAALDNDGTVFLMGITGSF